MMLRTGCVTSPREKAMSACSIAGISRSYVNTRAISASSSVRIMRAWPGGGAMSVPAARVAEGVFLAHRAANSRSHPAFVSSRMRTLSGRHGRRLPVPSHSSRTCTMARGINKVILIGNLGADPETRAMPSGTTVANLRVATSESWRDKQTGEQQERTEWHRVAFFGRLAEVAGEYLRKGSQVYIEGSLRTRKWQDKQGNERYSTEIIGNELQMLGGRGGAGGAGAAPVSAGAGSASPPSYAEESAGGGSRSEEFDDDIPF